jgi:phosphohistidine phosphatase
MTDGKILYLVRHAESSWSGSDLSDFDRPLNERGFRDAPEMSRRLKARGILPETVLCSMAKRAVQTLDNMDLDIENEVFDERIYEASKGELLDIIQSLKNHYGSAMLIGHNPAVTWLTNQLSGTHIDNMPTCSIATIQLASTHWGNVASCPAKLLNFDYPEKTA